MAKPASKTDMANQRVIAAISAFAHDLKVAIDIANYANPGHWTAKSKLTDEGIEFTIAFGKPIVEG